jgi:hypothetical protein
LVRLTFARSVRKGQVMPRRRKEEVDARVEEVGSLRARGVPVAELAAKFDVTDRQIRLYNEEWLRRRKAERATDGLQLEEVLAQCEEVASAAWHDHELLGAGMTSLDPKTARARSELLRIALAAIDRKVSLLGLSTAAQDEEGGAPKNGSPMDIQDADVFWEQARKLEATMRRDFEIILEAVRRGENVPDLRPLGPGVAERLEAEWKQERACAEDPGEPADGKEHRRGDDGCRG